MAVTYDKIATATLGSAGVGYFTSIPASYTDLVLVVAGTFASGAGTAVSLQFNSAGGTAYSNTFIYGDGTNAVSGRGSNQNKVDAGYMDGSNQGNTIVQIQNYANTTTYKSVLGRGSSSSLVYAMVGLWRSTAAIDSISILTQSGVNYAAGTRFTLYGIKAA